MSRWILIAIVILNIYVFLNLSHESRTDIGHAVVQIPAKIGDVIHDFADKVEDTR